MRCRVRYCVLALACAAATTFLRLAATWMGHEELSPLHGRAGLPSAPRGGPAAPRPRRSWSDARRDCNYRCYLDRYPDLKRSLRDDVEAAKRHYIATGHKEGMDCTCIEGPRQSHCGCGRYNGTLKTCIGAEVARCEGCALWESWPPLPAHKARPRYDTAEIVVSYCNQENFAWLHRAMEEVGKVSQLIRVTIYSKCGGKAAAVAAGGNQLPFIRKVNAENVGRNDHAFLYHIATHYEDLLDLVFFLKDTSFVYPIQELQHLIVPMRTLARRAVRDSFACGRRAHHGTSIWHLRHELWKFRMPKYRSALGYQQLPEDFLAPLSFCAFLASNLASEEMSRLLRHGLLPVCYGGTFASARHRIHRTQRQTWRRLAGALTRGDNIEEGHYLERLWASLLAPLLAPEAEDGLAARSAAMHTRFGEQLGFSYMGSLKLCCCDHAGDAPLGDDLRPTLRELRGGGGVQPVSNVEPIALARDLTWWDRTRRFMRHSSLTVVAVSHSWDLDGAPQYLWRVAKHVLAKGGTVVAVSPKAGSLRQRYDDAGAKTLLLADSVRGLPPFSWSNYTSWEMSVWNEAMLTSAADLAGARPDIVIYNTVLWAPVVSQNQRHCLLRPRLVWMIHEFEISPEHSLPGGFWWGERYKELRSWSLRRTTASADAVVFVSRKQREIWNRHDTGNFHTLPGLPQTQPRGAMPTTRASLGIPETAFVMTAVGSFCKRKQQLWAIRALEVLLASGIDAYLLLVGQASPFGGAGDPHYAQSVEERAQAGALRGRLRLLPFGPNPARYVRLADLHLSASTHEAYPLNTLEAMQLGVPVVATAAGGTEEQFLSPEVQWLLVQGKKLTDFAEVVMQAYGAFADNWLRDVGQRMRADHADAVQRFEAGLEAILGDVTRSWSKNRATLGDIPVCDLSYTCWRKDARQLGHEL